MKISDFEKELKAIDPRLAIIPNHNRPAGEGNPQGISNIKLDGRDVIPVPSDEISDEPDNNMRYVFPNGMSARHKSRQEALAVVHDTLKKLETKEYADLFFEKE